jgi:methylglutaconyl-CoA hydratase
MPDAFTRLRVVSDGPVVRITLVRPEARNAFDEVLIAELTQAFSDLAAGGSARVVVLSGEGPSFCAGADVAWMRKAGSYTRDQNEEDAGKMARMFRAIDACPIPVVALAHGAFSLAEVKLGILPSVISPYVLRAIGARQARDLFLTGDRFDAREAHRIGLVHAVAPADELAAAGEKKVRSLLTSGPEAVGVAKRLIETVAGLPVEDAIPLTVRTIAERRASEEAREGLTAFLEKRKPKWSG